MVSVLTTSPPTTAVCGLCHTLCRAALEQAQCRRRTGTLSGIVCWLCILRVRNILRLVHSH
jgi:hypothetical protein